MNKVFGYCRISTASQSIQRQIRNILAVDPAAEIYKEAYTGTKIQGRKQLDRLLKQVQPGDTIIFDAVDRMSRNAAEGVELYMDLFKKGIKLHFIKQPHLDTEVYKKSIADAVPMTGTAVDCILSGVNEYIRILAKSQIELAFNQAQAEVDHLHERTKEGMETARRAGKQIGLQKGIKLTTKKSIEAKKAILKHSKTFGGSLGDIECMKLTHIARGTFYKYKKELIQEGAAL